MRVFRSGEGHPDRHARPTRPFIAHGGLAPDYVEKTLGFASVDFTAPLKQAMDELNKRTHVKPDTVLGEEEPVRWLAAKVFDAIEGLLEAADECHLEVVVELRDQIDQQLLERMIGETIGELDILSGHTLVGRAETTEIEVTEITDQIRFRSEGTIYVTLQWGSGSDFRGGAGAWMSEEFPFSAALITATADPSKFEAVIDLNVDTDGWYE